MLTRNTKFSKFKVNLMCHRLSSIFNAEWAKIFTLSVSVDDNNWSAKLEKIKLKILLLARFNWKSFSSQSFFHFVLSHVYIGRVLVCIVLYFLFRKIIFGFIYFLSNCMFLWGANFYCTTDYAKFVLTGSHFYHCHHTWCMQILL